MTWTKKTCEDRKVKIIYRQNQYFIRCLSAAHNAGSGSSRSKKTNLPSFNGGTHTLSISLSLLPPSFYLVTGRRLVEEAYKVKVGEDRAAAVSTITLQGKQRVSFGPLRIIALFLSLSLFPTASQLETLILRASEPIPTARRGRHVRGNADYFPSVSALISCLNRRCWQGRGRRSAWSDAPGSPGGKRCAMSSSPAAAPMFERHRAVAHNTVCLLFIAVLICATFLLFGYCCYGCWSFKAVILAVSAYASIHLGPYSSMLLLPYFLLRANLVLGES